MSKKTILGVIFAFSLVFCELSSQPTFADAIQPVQCTGSEFHTYCNNDYECHENATGEQVCEYIEEFEEGTSGEPEVVCADENESDCQNTTPESEVVEPDGTEEAIEPELWPLIVSLSALGATIVFVIIINLCGRQPK